MRATAIAFGAAGIALLMNVPATAYNDHFLLNCTIHIGDKDYNYTYDLNVGARTVTFGSQTLELNVMPTQYSWTWTTSDVSWLTKKYTYTVDRVTGSVTDQEQEIFVYTNPGDTKHTYNSLYTGNCRRVPLGARF